MVTFLAILVTALIVFMITVAIGVWLVIKFLRNSPADLVYSAEAASAQQRINSIFETARARMAKTIYDT